MLPNRWTPQFLNGALNFAATAADEWELPLNGEAGTQLLKSNAHTIIMVPISVSRETVRQQQSARAADVVTPLPNLRQELFATVTIPN